VGFNRGNFFSALAGLIVGVMLVSVLPAAANNGDYLVLGEKNTARRMTQVTTKNGFLFRTTKVGVPAATFEVLSGPPIAVNNTTKVSRLNADYLDGWNARELRTTWGWRSNGNIANNVEWVTSRSATVPIGGGVILMSASVDFYNSSASVDLIECFFSVNGTQIGESRMTVTVQAGQEAACHSDAASEQPSGTYTVEFETSGLADSHLWAEDGFWYFMTLPN